MQKIIANIAKENHLGLWETDWMWWEVQKRERGDGKERHWLVKPGTGGDDWENQRAKGVAGIGFVNADLSQFCKKQKI